MSSGSAAAVDAAFVLCIEDNETRDQALLLIESLRAFGGRFAKSRILAVAPRRGLGVDAPTRERLETLEVEYHDQALNSICPEYAPANRVFAGAWAAETCRVDTIFVLDSDALFLGEPEGPGDDADLAVRPVDVKGSTSSGRGDPFEAYWASACGLAGISIESLPFVETVLDHRRVRASYNAGYAAVRRSSGILQRTAEVFTRTVLADLRPYKGHRDHRMYASTGQVSPVAGEYWGSSQAALSIAAWSTTRRVRELDRRFNVPLHGLADEAHWSDDWLDLRPVHVHYHWMLGVEHRERALRTMARIGVPADRLEWIETRIARWERQRAPTRVRPRGRQVVICGMHRSATSLVASVLAQAGLEIGTELMGAGPGNRRGHFEDRDFWQLHEDMLAAAGGTALEPGADLALPPQSDAALVPDDRFERRARSLIEQRAGHDLWGWKDPRTCLFLEFWDALLPDASYVILYRHPIEVALSLRRRATEPEMLWDPWAGIRAWEVYNRRLLDFLDRHPERCFLAQVPALTSDLPAFVRRVAIELDLPLRGEGAAALLASGELATELGSAGHDPDWEALMPEALALYRRLEAKADLPSWQERAGTAGDRPPGPAVEELLRELVVALETRASEEPTERRRIEAFDWTIADGQRRLEEVRAQLADRQRMGAELRRRLTETVALHERAEARCEELAATLEAIERSRSFRFVAAWWRLAGWFGRRGRGRRVPSGESPRD